MTASSTPFWSERLEGRPLPSSLRPIPPGSPGKCPQIARVVTAREVRIRSHGEEIVTCLDGECFRSGEVTMRLAEKRVRFSAPGGAAPTPRPAEAAPAGAAPFLESGGPRVGGVFAKFTKSS